MEVLQKRFADFVHSVLASEDRVVHVNTLADTLVEANHTGKLVHTVKLTLTVGVFHKHRMAYTCLCLK